MREANMRLNERIRTLSDDKVSQKLMEMRREYDQIKSEIHQSLGTTQSPGLIRKTQMLFTTLPSRDLANGINLSGEEVRIPRSNSTTNSAEYYENRRIIRPLSNGGSARGEFSPVDNQPKFEMTI